MTRPIQRLVSALLACLLPISAAAQNLPRTVNTVAELLVTPPSMLAATYAGTTTNFPATVMVMDGINGLPSLATWDATSTAATNWRVRAVAGHPYGRWRLKPWASSPITTATTLIAIGDSITHGANVSASTPQLRWPLVFGETNGWTISVAAWGGSKIADMIYQAFPGLNYTNVDFGTPTIYSSPSAVTAYMIFCALMGYNDMRDLSPNSNYQTHFRRALGAYIVWTGLPHSAKKMAQSADTVSGTWTPMPDFGGAMGMSSSTVGDYLTSSNVLGNTVYVCFMAHPATNDDRSFSVLIDSTGHGSTTCGPAYGNRYYEGGNPFQPLYVGPNHDGNINAVPWLLAFRGLSRTAHTIKLTVTGASNGPVEILWVAGNGGQYNGQTGPYTLIGNTLRSSPIGYGVAGSDANAGGFSRQMEDVIASYQRDGVKVLYVDANRYFDPATMMSSDNVHPNEAGHAAIARAFQEAITPDIPQISATRQSGGPVVYLEGSTLVVKLPSNTGQESRELIADGGAPPFLSFDALAPQVNGTFVQIKGTPASKDGLQRVLDIPLIISQGNNVGGINTSTGGYVGLGVRVTESSLGSGSHYPFVVSIAGSGTNLDGTTNNPNSRFLAQYKNDGTFLHEVDDSSSGGKLITFAGTNDFYYVTNVVAGVTNITLLHATTKITLKVGDFSDRALLITGNSVSSSDTNGTAQNLSLGNGANVVAPGSDDSTGFRLGTSSGPLWSKGASSPEGVNSGPIGSIRSQTDGSPGSAAWIRTTTSGSELNWRKITDQSRMVPTPATLTDGATITWTMDNTYPRQQAVVTLGGNRTLDLESLQSGMTGSLKIIQDGTGSRTLSPGGSSTNIITGGGSTLGLSTAASGVDLWTWIFISPNVYWFKSYGQSTPYPGLAAVATSGSATDITTGQLPSAQLPTNVSISGTLQVAGAVTNQSTLGVAGVSTFSGKITPAAGIVGVAGTTSAATGNIGEYLSSTIASGSAVSLTTATYANITSITLTAGDWDLYGSVTITAATAATTGFIGGIGTSSGAAMAENCYFNLPLVSGSMSAPVSLPVPHQRVSISATTTYYLNCRGVFSSGSETAYGRIEARRSANAN